MEKIQSVVFGLGRIGMLYGLGKKRIQPASHIEAIKNNKKFTLNTPARKVRGSPMIGVQANNSIQVPSLLKYFEANLI